MSRYVGLGIMLLTTTCALAAACGGSSGKSSETVTSSSSGHGGASSSASTGSSAHGGASNGSGGLTGPGGGLSFEGGLADAPSYDGDACGSMTLTQTLTPGNIIVVFDQSDSMGQTFGEADAGADGGVSGPKWQVAENALVAALTPIESLVNAGAVFFPTTATGNTCSTVVPITMAPQIEIESGKAFVKDFQAHFSAMGWTLILGTPTVDALTNTDTALPNPSPLKGQRAVVLITDGAPTCDTKQADILAPVQDMFSRGIKTYAVGLPGSASAANLLNAIAQAGGTGNYLSPSDPAALQTALAQIASDTLDKCTITLNPAPQDPTQVHLVVTDSQDPNGVEIPRVDAGDGWTLSADGTTATLDGAVCATAKNGGYTSIQFVYGCLSLN